MTSKSDLACRIRERRLRVLVVDDRDGFRKALVLRLKRVYSATVEDVGAGANAIKRSHESGFDLILMDVAMPGMDGIKAAKAILADGTCHRVVLMSAQAENEGEAKALGLGFLSKPIETSELESVLLTCRR